MGSPARATILSSPTGLCEPAAVRVPATRSALVTLIIAIALAGCGDSGGSSDDAVDGDGYTYSVPADWVTGNDAAADAAQAGIDAVGLGGAVGLDSLSIDTRPEGGFSSNVNVLSPLPAQGFSAVEALELSNGSLENLPAGAGFELTGSPTDPESTTLDGDEAAFTEYHATQDGGALKLRQLLAIHEGEAYMVTFTTSAAKFDSEVAEFEEILESWAWE